jgi:hypothetical protein
MPPLQQNYFINSPMSKLMFASDRDICLLAEPLACQAFSEDSKISLVHLLSSRNDKDSSSQLFIRIAALSNPIMRSHLLLEWCHGLAERDFKENSYRKRQLESLTENLIHGILISNSPGILDQQIISQADPIKREILSKIAIPILKDIKKITKQHENGILLTFRVEKLWEILETT